MIYYMHPTTMNYEWGDTHRFNTLLQTNYPLNTPYAELWMGAHPKNSASIVVDNENIPLNEWYSNNNNNIFPFLYKLLAIKTPLSVQSHPHAQDAQKWYKKEWNDLQAGTISDDMRIFFDSNEKSETFVALQQTYCLCSVRPINELIHEFTTLATYSELPWFIDIINGIEYHEGIYLEQLFYIFTQLSHEKKNILLHCIAKYCKEYTTYEKSCRYYWFLQMHQYYPQDMGAFASLYLQLHVLEYGDALFIQPGIIHCYLQGAGLELITNSDNIARIGCTKKYCNVLMFMNISIMHYTPVTIIQNTTIYSNDHNLLQLQISDNYNSDDIASISIVLCLEGQYTAQYQNTTLTMKQGEVIFITKQNKCTITKTSTHGCLAYAYVKKQSSLHDNITEKIEK